MSKPIYHYFHCKALGEGPRMLMAYGDYEFEDVRHFLADFPEFKPKTPFGQLPMLIVDGNEYAQSMALSRYFGRKFGLAGDNDEEALEVDSIAEFLNDIRAKAAMVFYEADEERKVARNADFHKNVYPALLGKLASIAEKNNGHLALGRLTWADFSFTGVFDYLKTMMQVPDLEDRYPVFKRVHQSVLTIPKVKKFVDNAPLSEPALPF